MKAFPAYSYAPFSYLRKRSFSVRRFSANRKHSTIGNAFRRGGPAGDWYLKAAHRKGTGL